MKFSTKLSLWIFGRIAAARGYRFAKVATAKEHEDASRIYDEQGFSFPEHLAADVQKYKAGAINFIAYYKDRPAGVVRLADPKVINRAYEHYGVDKEGIHHEIQSLVVKKEYRDGAQFVMLGLIKELYAYSIANSITSWSACGVKSVYMTMRKYCKKIEVIDVDFKNISHPVTQYLYANNIADTYFIMAVSSFAPWQILKKYIKKSVKKWNIRRFINNDLPVQTLLKKNSAQGN